MAIELPQEINTPQLLEAAIFELERLRNWGTDSSVKTKVGVDLDSEPSLSDETQKLVTDYGSGKALTAAKLAALIKELKSLKPVTVHITLAAAPTAGIKMSLISWFRQNVEKDILIGFASDRTIGGGIIIRTPNRIFDYSFRKKLIDGRSKIPEIIRNVR